MGSRLRKLRTQYRGKKLQDGKILTGARRLTERQIDTLQIYFGIAIRENKGNLLGMQRSVMAALYLVSSTDEEPNHSFCPDGPNTWCKYNLDPSTYKHRHGLPQAVVDMIEPIFSELADSDLFCKCLHGQTQNNDESINNMIWKYCPKEVFVSRPVVSDAAHFAVAVFNDGNDAFVKLFEQLGLSGGFTVKSALSSDTTRLYHAKRKSSDQYKITRKRLRAEKKGFIDTKNEEEGNAYESGAH